MQKPTQDLHDKFEPKPDAQALTSHSEGTRHGVNKDVDYEPHPEKSVNISPEHEKIIEHILNLYGGSAREEDMQGNEVVIYKSMTESPI